jgi:beta-lactam-binding protein with PASTA domain
MLAKNRIPDGDYPPMVEVPRVSGLTVARARDMLHAAGLGLDFKFGQDTDLVGNQNPYPGKVVPSRTVVTLGNLKARVPEVVGMKYSEAAKLLQDLHGFKVISTLSIDNDLAITDQLPLAGLFKPRGSQINIQHMVPIPDVEALDVDAAVRKLKDAGFAVNVETQYVAGDPVYAVFPRNKVALGSEVRITPGVKVPNIVGMSSSQAELALSRSGVQGRIGAILTQKGPRSEPVVHSQGIVPGRTMSRKEQLVINIIQYVQ